MKKLIRILGASALALTAALSSVQLGAQTMTLRLSNWLPPGQTLRVHGLEPWMTEVEKVTQGRVKVEMLPKVVGTLGAQFDVARDGQADVVILVNGYTPGRFDVSEIVELPFTSDDAETYAPLVDRFSRKHLLAHGEYNGVHPLSIFVVGAGQLFNSKRPIRTLADLKGLKLRSPQPGVTQSISLMGAVPVAKPVSELYELLSGKVLDGALVIPEAVMSFKLLEHVPYATIIPGALYNTMLTLAMNEDKWGRLSKADQDAIMGISGEVFARKVGRAHKEADEKAWAALRTAGKSVLQASPQLVGELQTALRPVETAWFEKARKKGVAQPEKLLEALRAEAATGRVK